MTQNAKRLKRRGVALVLALVLALSCILTGCGGADSADAPAELNSASEFNRWFSEKGFTSLSGKKTPGTYYFKLTGDLELTAAGVIGNGHTVTIDLNGHTITGKQLVQAFRVIEGATLNLTGGKIEMAGADTNGGLITVDGAGSALHLKDMVLTNTDDSGITANTHNGGVIYVNSPVEEADHPAVVTMQGNTVITGSSSGLRVYGGAVFAEGSSQFYMYDGSIQNGKAGSGGNVSIDGQAQFFMHNGTISKGTSSKTIEYTGNGGNVAIENGARFHLYGGTVTDGHSGMAGGNFSLFSYGAVEALDGLHVFGGTIQNGSASTMGGNIFATEQDSTVCLYGGTVSSGDARYGGNIYLEVAKLVMRGGTLTGLSGYNTNESGGNVYANGGSIDLYDGIVEKSRTLSSGANIYVTNALVNIYGGSIVEGVAATTSVPLGGGNLYAAGKSVVNIYDGEIRDGLCNDMKEEAGAGGPNVMLAGKATCHMFGGTIKNGQVYGTTCRGGGVYVYGQNSGDDCTFHMYGGVIENGLLSDSSFGAVVMRGLAVGAYSQVGEGGGLGIARIFEGTINYLGPANSIEKRNTLFSRHSGDTCDLFVFDEDIDPALTRDARVGPCTSSSHYTQVETQEATCVVPGYIKYSCNSCGEWCQVTAPATGHTAVTEAVIAPTALEAGRTEHTCSACDGFWVTDVLPADPAAQN